MVQLRISRGTQVFEALAMVAHCKLGMGMGLAFVSAQEEHKKLLGSWIVEVGGELPEAPAPKSDEVKGMSNDQLSKVVSELLQLLMRKGVLTEAERQEILTNSQS
jgi:hypothetical protein